MFRNDALALAYYKQPIALDIVVRGSKKGFWLGSQAVLLVEYSLKPEQSTLVYHEWGTALVCNGTSVICLIRESVIVSFIVFSI